MNRHPTYLKMRNWGSQSLCLSILNSVWTLDLEQDLGKSFPSLVSWDFLLTSQISGKENSLSYFVPLWEGSVLFRERRVHSFELQFWTLISVVKFLFPGSYVIPELVTRYANKNWNKLITKLTEVQRQIHPSTVLSYLIGWTEKNIWTTQLMRIIW